MSNWTRLVPITVLGLVFAALVALPTGNYGFAQYSNPGKPGKPADRPADKPANPPDNPEEDLPEESEMAGTMKALRAADTRLQQMVRKRAKGRPAGAVARDPVSRELRGALANVQRARQQCQKAWKLDKLKRR